MYYIVLEIYIRGSFLKDCFYCYSHQFISAVAKDSLIPYNLLERAPETQNATPNQIKKTTTTPKKTKNVKYSPVCRTKDLFYTNINNINSCKIICKMHCAMFKKWLVIQCIRWISKFY